MEDQMWECESMKMGQWYAIRKIHFWSDSLEFRV